MKLTIFAATGGVGHHLLEQAHSARHDVTTVVRNPRTLTTDADRTVVADLSSAEPEALTPALIGADAVLSCLGARSPADAESRIVARGTETIMAAMHTCDVRRLVVISAAPVGTVASPQRPHPPKADPGDGLMMGRVMTPLVKFAFRKAYADLAEMEDALRASDLDWTALRPPRLTNKPLTGRYRMTLGQNPLGGRSISRADVANAILAVLDQPETIRRTVGVAY